MKSSNVKCAFYMKICRLPLQPRQLNPCLPRLVPAPSCPVPSIWHIHQHTRTLETAAAPRSAQTCTSTGEIGNCCCDEGKGAKTGTPLFWAMRSDTTECRESLKSKKKPNIKQKKRQMLDLQRHLRKHRAQDPRKSCESTAASSGCTNNLTNTHQCQCRESTAAHSLPVGFTL